MAELEGRKRPFMPTNLLVGTDDGIHQLGNSGKVHLPGRKCTSISNGPSGIWTLVDRRELWHCPPGGRWKQIAQLDEFEAQCVIPTPAGVLVGTSEAHLSKLVNERFEPVSSFDRAEGRDSWFTPWGGPPAVRSLSTDPDGAIYANVHVGGVLRSTDRGRSWQPTIDIHADVHQVVFDAGSGLLLAASLEGLAVSEDRGESWTFNAEGLHASYCRAVAVAGETVLVTASTGPFTDRAAVYRVPLPASGAFEKCAAGLPKWFPKNVDTYCLATSGDETAFGTSDGQVFRSSDEGRTWETAADGLPRLQCVSFV